MSERVIVAPAAGVFSPCVVGDGEPSRRTVCRGEVIGTITSWDSESRVPSRFSGLLMGLLALPGHRVRKGQAVAWVRSSEGPAAADLFTDPCIASPAR